MGEETLVHEILGDILGGNVYLGKKKGDNFEI